MWFTGFVIARQLLIEFDEVNNPIITQQDETNGEWS